VSPCPYRTPPRRPTLMAAEPSPSGPQLRHPLLRMFRGALWIVGLGVLGLALAVPDLPARVEGLFRTEFPLMHPCDPWAGPCAASSPDGPLAVGWSPMGLAGTVSVWADAKPEYRPVSAIWTGRDMNMGRTVFPFTPPSTEGRAEAHGVLPVCTLSQMAWRLDVVWEDPQGQTSQTSITVHGGQTPRPPP
jgi:hypothetical protein